MATVGTILNQSFNSDWSDSNDSDYTYTNSYSDNISDNISDDNVIEDNIDNIHKNKGCCIIL